MPIGQNAFKNYLLVFDVLVCWRFLRSFMQIQHVNWKVFPRFVFSLNIKNSYNGSCVFPEGPPASKETCQEFVFLVSWLTKRSKLTKAGCDICVQQSVHLLLGMGTVPAGSTQSLNIDSPPPPGSTVSGSRRGGGVLIDQHISHRDSRRDRTWKHLCLSFLTWTNSYLGHVSVPLFDFENVDPWKVFCLLTH